MSDELKALVDKFLCWKLPQHFAPDCGISFDGRKDDEWNKNKTWPTGTNLFTADQAEAMLRDIGVAALIEKNARLERHAEALAEYITDKHCSGVNCESCKLVNAFRADFPRKEGT